MKLKKYNKCIFCGSKTLILEKKQKLIKNFYIDAIKSDLNISDKILLKMKLYRCKVCDILQNNPWFTDDDVFKIYNQIYGQHNRSWTNVIRFFRNGIKPNHGKLFDLITKKIKVKNYAEFNSPFMGLMIDFFSKEFKNNTKVANNAFTDTLNYLKSRQVAGNNNLVQKKSQYKATKILKKINRFKNLYLKKKAQVNKFLFVDNSFMAWGINDNYKSVNSKALAAELFNIKINNIYEKNKVKFDLFGIFHTLDHTKNPKKILDFALNNSNYVIIYCHVDENLEKQHLFTFTKNFTSYLRKKKINVLDLTYLINKEYRSEEMYLLCSKKNLKKNIY